MRAALSLTCLLLLLGTFTAQGQEPIFENPSLPVSAEVMAQGGSFTANASGYNALFYNPAGFVSSRGSLTLISASSWAYANPVRLLDSSLSWDDLPALTDFIEGELTSGGFGIGSCAGIGYVGRGLGLGATLSMDSYLWGPTVLGVQGSLEATLAFVGGFAVPVNLFGMKISLGADVRPLIRIKVPVDYTTTLDILGALQGGGDPLAAINSAPALYGFGFGIDLGAILSLGGLNVGLSVRDFLNTRISYSESSFGEIQSSFLSTGGFPSDGSPVAGDRIIPMDLSAGVAYRIDLGGFSRVMDPVIHASLSDVIGVIREKRSPWALLHLGADVRLLRFLSLRAGLNQGYVTFGAGVRLLFIDLDCALFTREMGRHLGDRPSSGLAVEAALRL